MHDIFQNINNNIYSANINQNIIFPVYAASAVPVNSDYSEDRVYPRFIEFPDGEGVMHTVDLEAEPDMDLLDEIARNPANNKYFLYTRYSPKDQTYTHSQ